MDRRQSILAIALIALAAGAALWFAIGGGRSTTEPLPLAGNEAGTQAPEAPPPPPAAVAPTLAPAKPRPLATAPETAAGGATGTGSISVVVRDEDEKPIAGAAVAAWRGGKRVDGRTNAAGIATLADVPPDWYRVSASAEGFGGDEQDDIEVESGKVKEVAFSLESGVAFDGVVVEAGSMRPVPKARIVVTAGGSVGGYVSMKSREPYGRMVADDEGRFHVNGVPEDEVATVEASASGYRDGAFSVRILGGAVTPLPVVVPLGPGGRIVGVVRDEEGRPFPGATVYVVRAADEDIRKNPRLRRTSSDGTRAEATTGKSGEGGVYEVAGLALEEEYVAIADADWHARSEEAMGLLLTHGRRERTADLALRAPSTVVVRVLDAEGSPLREPATVRLGDIMGGHRRTEPDEAPALYRFGGVDPGVWQVSVESTAAKPAHAEVKAESGKTADVVVRLDPGASIEGVVVDEAGKPVKDASVYAGPESKNSRRLPGFDDDTWYFDEAREVTTGADGKFRLAGLDAGPSVVGAQVYARIAGAEYRTREVLKVAAPAAGLRLVMVRLGSASLRLVRPDGSPYVGGAMVWTAKTGRQGRGGSGEHVKDGKVHLDGLGDGEVLLDVTQLDGFAPVHRVIEAHVGKHVDLGDVVLDSGLSLSGRVVDLEGAPVAGARVTPADGDETAADDRGAFQLDHLAPGPLVVEAEGDGFLGRKESVDVRPGMARIEIRLSRGALVRAVVKGADGKPAGDARLVAILLGPDGKPIEKGAREWDAAKDDGRVEWRVPPGRWRLAWGVNGGTEYREVPLGEWTLAEGETKDLELTLPAR